MAVGNASLEIDNSARPYNASTTSCAFSELITLPKPVDLIKSRLIDEINSLIDPTVDKSYPSTCASFKISISVVTNVAKAAPSALKSTA